jgi:hypothetical protein
VGGLTQWDFTRVLDCRLHCGHNTHCPSFSIVGLMLSNNTHRSRS